MTHRDNKKGFSTHSRLRSAAASAEGNAEPHCVHSDSRPPHSHTVNYLIADPTMAAMDGDQPIVIVERLWEFVQDRKTGADRTENQVRPLW